MARTGRPSRPDDPILLEMARIIRDNPETCPTHAVKMLWPDLADREWSEEAARKRLTRKFQCDRGRLMRRVALERQPRTIYPVPSSPIFGRGLAQRVRDAIQPSTEVFRQLQASIGLESEFARTMKAINTAKPQIAEFARRVQEIKVAIQPSTEVFRQLQASIGLEAEFARTMKAINTAKPQMAEFARQVQGMEAEFARLNRPLLLSDLDR